MIIIKKASARVVKSLLGGRDGRPPNRFGGKTCRRNAKDMRLNTCPFNVKIASLSLSPARSSRGRRVRRLFGRRCPYFDALRRLPRSGRPILGGHDGHDLAGVGVHHRMNLTPPRNRQNTPKHAKGRWMERWMDLSSETWSDAILVALCSFC